MVIHTIGDSHGYYTFLDIPGITPHTLGPLTMRRVGLLEDTVVPNAVRELNLTPTDTLILCFGEPDIRCHVHRHVTDRKIAPDALLQLWTERYFASVAAFQTNGARIGIMSVTPPCRAAHVAGQIYPSAGTDEERANYTRTLNALLRSGCESVGWLFVDVYSEYVDPSGMMNMELSGDGVHCTTNGPVIALFQRMGLLP